MVRSAGRLGRLVADQPMNLGGSPIEFNCYLPGESPIK